MFDNDIDKLEECIGLLGMVLGTHLTGMHGVVPHNADDIEGLLQFSRKTVLDQPTNCVVDVFLSST